jgi:hypothetical protein
MPIVAIIGCFLVIVLVLFNSPSWSDLPVLIGLILLSWVIHLMMIRPRIFLDDDLLVLQGAVLDREIPVVMVTEVLIGNYAKIVTTAGNYTSPAISRRLRGRALRGPGERNQVTQADLLEADLNRLLEREEQELAPEFRVRNQWAWPELGVLLGLGLLVVLSVLGNRILG